jgi:cardiolipin synthase (CMP-forming)
MASPDRAGASAPAAGTDGADDLDRILTVPNAVTVVRLLCVPLFVWLLFGAHQQTAAAILLGVLGATDWVDGQIARRFHQVSTLGKVLDPVADRVLVGTAVVSVMVHGAVPLWFGIATLAREVLVSATVLVLAALGARRIDVLWIGKAGAFGLMWAYPAFLLSDGTASWQVPFHVLAWITGGVGLALAWVAAVAYLWPARRALAEGRRDRAAAKAAGTATVPGGAGTGGTGGGVGVGVGGTTMSTGHPGDGTDHEAAGDGPHERGTMQHTREIGA